VRGLLLSLFVVLGIALNAQPALAVTCARQNATELMQRGDVAATGFVDFSWSVPFGFIFAADGVYKGSLPAHVLVLGQFRPSDLGATRHFVVMRFHLPGVYSMDVCDGREMPDLSLGSLGDGRAPSPDLPVAPAAAGLVLVLALLLLARRGRGKPPAAATATAY